MQLRNLIKIIRLALNLATSKLEVDTGAASASENHIPNGSQEKLAVPPPSLLSKF